MLSIFSCTVKSVFSVYKIPICSAVLSFFAALFSIVPCKTMLNQMPFLLATIKMVSGFRRPNGIAHYYVEYKQRKPASGYPKLPHQMWFKIVQPFGFVYFKKKSNESIEFIIIT